MQMPMDYPDAQLRCLPGNDTWNCFRRHRELTQWARRSRAPSTEQVILDCRGR